jgi:hypothetical protein
LNELDGGWVLLQLQLASSYISEGRIDDIEAQSRPILDEHPFSSSTTGVAGNATGVGAGDGADEHSAPQIERNRHDATDNAITRASLRDGAMGLRVGFS